MAQSFSKDKGEQIFVIFNVPAGCKPSDTADPGGVSAHVACGPHPDWENTLHTHPIDLPRVCLVLE